MAELRLHIDEQKDSCRHRLGLVGFSPRLHIRLASKGMDLEKELWEVFEQVLHEDFPNPQRANCPGFEALLELAGRSGPLRQTSVLAHIRQCAPCFNEVKVLRSKTSDRTFLPI